MLSLDNLQKLFANTFYDQEKGQLYNHIYHDHLDPKERLQIYHNNYYHNLTECLQKIFTAVEKLIGEECFIGLAKQYIQHSPPSSGNVHDFGKQLAHFLANNTALQLFPYLSEVAQLDWAYHEIFHDEDYGLFHPSQLNIIATEKYNEVKFKINPTAMIFSFNFPIYHIWQVCHHDDKQNEIVNLDEGGEKILIFKSQYEIYIDKLTKGEYTFLNALNHQYDFARCCTLALDADTSINIENFLQKCVACGTIVGLL